MNCDVGSLSYRRDAVLVLGVKLKMSMLEAHNELETCVMTS